MLAAQEKAGKTWLALDLAVSVAAGLPWLDHFACPTPGGVLAFLGEGGEREAARRLEAIATHKGADLAQLAELVRLCFRVPRLAAPGAGGDLEAVAAELAAHPARLVLLDPLYLAAAGARSSDLFEMGQVLSQVQGVCQQAKAALVVVHHWNKTGQGNGTARMSGAGPGQWGRVLGSASVKRRVVDPDGASVVVLSVEFVGGEIPDQRFRLRRRVRAEDPTDLGSPLSYAVEVLPDERSDPVATPEGERGLSDAQQWTLQALRVGGAFQTVKQLGDRLAGDGTPLKARTIQAALAKLEELALAAGTEPERGRERYWSPADHDPAPAGEADQAAGSSPGGCA